MANETNPGRQCLSSGVTAGGMGGEGRVSYCGLKKAKFIKSEEKSRSLSLTVMNRSSCADDNLDPPVTSGQ